MLNNELDTPSSGEHALEGAQKYGCLWRLIATLIVIFVFVVAGAVYVWWNYLPHTLNLGQSDYSAGAPQTATELVQPGEASGKWTEATIICPYTDIAQLPDYAAEGASYANIDTVYDNRNYLVTNSGKGRVLEFSRGEVDLCGRNEQYTLDPDSTLEWSMDNNRWILNSLKGK